MELTSIEVTASAYDVLVGAMADARRENRELGGSLLAHERDGNVLVAYALPTGPHADRGPGHVRTDADFQNAAIERVRRRCPSLEYVGDWHVHPMFLPDLSGTDRRTAREILLDDGTWRDHLILLLVTAPPAGAAMVLGFVARLTRPGNVAIGKVQVTRVPDDAPRVVSILGRTLPPLRELLDGASTTAVGRQEPIESDSFDDPATIRLIEDDLAEVRGSLNAEASLWKDDDLLGAVIRRGDKEALVLFPPEYPLGAPQVFAVSEEAGPLAPIALRFGWSSLHRLADPVSEALAPKPSPATTRRKARAPASRTMRVLGNILSLLGMHRAGRYLAQHSPEVTS